MRLRSLPASQLDLFVHNHFFSSLVLKIPFSFLSAFVLCALCPVVICIVYCGSNETGTRFTYPPTLTYPCNFCLPWTELLFARYSSSVRLSLIIIRSLAMTHQHHRPHPNTIIESIRAQRPLFSPQPRLLRPMTRTLELPHPFHRT